MNKPVVVSEEVLTEPVIVDDASPALTASVAGPAYVVLAGISFSHFLNDTMQSLRRFERTRCSYDSGPLPATAFRL